MAAQTPKLQLFGTWNTPCRTARLRTMDHGPPDRCCPMNPQAGCLASADDDRADAQTPGACPRTAIRRQATSYMPRTKDHGLWTDFPNEPTIGMFGLRHMDCPDSSCPTLRASHVGQQDQGPWTMDRFPKRTLRTLRTKYPPDFHPCPGTTYDGAKRPTCWRAVPRRFL